MQEVTFAAQFIFSINSEENNPGRQIRIAQIRINIQN